MKSKTTDAATSLLIKEMIDNVRLKEVDFKRLVPYRLIVRPNHRFLAIMTSKSRGTEGSKEGDTERCRRNAVL